MTRAGDRLSQVLLGALLFFLPFVFLATIPMRGVVAGVWRPGGLRGTAVLEILIVPSDQEATLYAATDHRGVMRSLDGGRSWLPMNDGLPAGWLGERRITTLVASPGAPEQVYVVCITGGSRSSGWGLYRTVDGEASWQEITWREEDSVLRALALGPGGSLYVATGDGLYLSVDGGDSWARQGRWPEDSTALSLMVDPADPDLVYLGTDRGTVYRTTDGGRSWSAASEGLEGEAVFTLAAGGQEEGVLYAGTASGAFRTQDGGLRWKRLSGLPVKQVSAIVVDPVDERIICIAMEGEGVYRTTDAGATWEPSNRGIGRARVSALAVDPLNRTKIYAGTDAGLWVCVVSLPPPAGVSASIGRLRSGQGDGETS